MKKRSWLGFSIVAYAATWISLLALVAFVGELGGKTVSVPPSTGHWLQALGINLALLALFGFQHSLMARPFFKRLMSRAVPEFANRSVFILASACTLALVIIAWQPLDATLWQVGWRPLKLALLSTFFLGALMILWATVEIDHFHFFGIKQSWRAALGKPAAEPEFRARGLYGMVRHPIHLGMLMLLWSAPTMTAGRLLFATGMTAYVLIGLRLEERDLLKALGRVYGDYMARIPMLLPGLRRSRRDDDDDGIFWGIDTPRIPLPPGTGLVCTLLTVAMTSSIVLEPSYPSEECPQGKSTAMQSQTVSGRRFNNPAS